MKEGITQHDVFSATEQLLAAGVNPSIRNVRNQIGRGSLTTISKHMAEWDRQKKTIDETAVEVSSTFTGAVKAELIRVVQAQRNLTGERLILLEENITDLQQAASDLESQNLYLQQEIAELGSERDKATGKASQLASDLQAAKQRLEIVQKEAEQARSNEDKERYLSATLKEHVASLENEVARLRSGFQSENEHRVVAEKNVAIFESKLAAATELVTKSDSRIAGLEDRLAATSDSLHKVQAELTTALRQLQDASSRAERAERDAEALLVRLTHLESLTTNLKLTSAV